MNSVVQLVDSGEESEQHPALSGKSVLQEVAISEPSFSDEVLPTQSSEKVVCIEIDNLDSDGKKQTHEPSCDHFLGQELGPDLKDCKAPVIIEIFCGSARVTASLRAIGLSFSFGVDHVKSNSQGPIKSC